MIKAALGGGGKGMRVVRNSEEFEKNFQNAQREAENGFGDNSMYIENILNIQNISSFRYWRIMRAIRFIWVNAIVRYSADIRK